MNPFVRILRDIVYIGLEKFGRYYSKYRAFVVDNDDPEKQGRLRLVIPGIADNPMDYWAWGTGQFSGTGFGCQVLPPKGATVWVEFELGDPNRPIWSHGHFAKADKIPKELQDPHIFWFKTPNGHILYLNDKTGELGITNKNGDGITSTDKGISAKTKNKIYLGDKEKGDETAALGNITEEILGVQVKAMGELSKGLSSNLKTTGQFFTKIAAASNPLLAAGVMVSEGPSLVKSIADTVKVADTFNESLSSLTEKIPLVKSQKVIIEK